MVVQISIQRIEGPPGQRVLLQDVSWEEFEAILQELGDRRSARIAYCDGTIFPKLDIRALPQLIEDNRSAGRLTLRRSVRAWVRRQVEA